jgi:hypothetical protein
VLVDTPFCGSRRIPAASAADPIDLRIMRDDFKDLLASRRQVDTGVRRYGVKVMNGAANHWRHPGESRGPPCRLTSRRQVDTSPGLTRGFRRYGGESGAGREISAPSRIILLDG